MPQQARPSATHHISASFESRLRALSPPDEADGLVKILLDSGAAGWMLGGMRCLCDIEEPSIDGFHMGTDGTWKGIQLSVRFAPDGAVARAVHGDDFLTSDEAEAALNAAIAVSREQSPR